MSSLGKKPSKKSCGRWHYYTTKDGRRVLRDPDGRDWFGTAQEVREAGLMPETLRDLRRSLRLLGIAAGSVEAAAMRQEAIQFDLEFLRKCGTSVSVTCDEYILLCAGARYMRRRHGVTDRAYWRGGIRSLIEGVIECALNDGLPELPLTRDERKALRCRQSKFSYALKTREAMAAKGKGVSA